jgi:hypothetical protein
MLTLIIVTPFLALAACWGTFTLVEKDSTNAPA